MRVLGVAVRRLELELVRPTVTAGGTHDKRPVVLVQIFTETGMGWGECDALAEPTYTAEYADGAESRLVEDLVPRLIGESFASASAVLDRLTDVAGNPMAKAAIEMAFLDAELRRDGVSLANRFPRAS